MLVKGAPGGLCRYYSIHRASKGVVLQWQIYLKVRRIWYCMHYKLLYSPDKNWTYFEKVTKFKLNSHNYASIIFPTQCSGSGPKYQFFRKLHILNSMHKWNPVGLVVFVLIILQNAALAVWPSLIFLCQTRFINTTIVISWSLMQKLFVKNQTVNCKWYCRFI